MQDVDEEREQMRIGDVARRTGLTVRTLRYYEEIGLLPPSERLAGGHRVYGEDDIRRLHRVNLLRHVGVPLAESGKHAIYFDRYKTCGDKKEKIGLTCAVVRID